MIQHRNADPANASLVEFTDGYVIQNPPAEP